MKARNIYPVSTPMNKLHDQLGRECRSEREKKILFDGLAHSAHAREGEGEGEKEGHGCNPKII